MSVSAAEVTYRAGGRALLDKVSVTVHPGRVHAVLGPNGAGKSTLLRLLAGELAPEAGAIALNGKALGAWSPRDRARQRAVLPQSHRLTFGFTAAQVVALGRLPCPRHRPEAESRIVHDALATTGAAELSDRKYPTLSGGERARVQLARVLAQVWEPLGGALADCARFLMLDEPTANLDLAHQHECLRAARAFAAQGGGVLVILHDPNLALRHADEVTLLRDGRTLAHGRPDDAITADNLERLYRVAVRIFRPDAASAPVVIVTDAVKSAAARDRSVA